MQDEVGVGRQAYAVQLEGELVGVLAGRELVLLDGGGRATTFSYQVTRPVSAGYVAKT